MSDVSLGSDHGLVAVRHEPEFESFRGYTAWICEKWSEEACDFARRKKAIVGSVSSEVLRKVVGKAEEEMVPGNLLVNEGIVMLLRLLVADTGSPTPFNNASAYIGVGDTATAATASDTELNATQNAANRFYKAMNATFPSRSSQTESWQSDFATTEANFAWNEWTISSGATTASGSGFLVGTTNLNHKIASLGTKTSGTWTLTGQITIS